MDPRAKFERLSPTDHNPLQLPRSWKQSVNLVFSQVCHVLAEVKIKVFIMIVMKELSSVLKRFV